MVMLDIVLLFVAAGLVVRAMLAGRVPVFAGLGGTGGRGPHEKEIEKEEQDFVFNDTTEPEFRHRLSILRGPGGRSGECFC